MADLRLLQAAKERQRDRRETLRQRTRNQLRQALRAALPEGFAVIVFGSLCHASRFSEGSDVDIAMDRLPAGKTLCDLTAELSARLRREVDVVELSRSRFAESIRQLGETWTA